MRWIVRLVLFVVVLALLGLGALFLIPAERIAGVAARQFEAATGRSLQIEGDLRPTLWPVIGVSTGSVRIANADWSQSGAPMVLADGLAIGLEALPLISGQIVVRELRIDGPQIVLERHADGRANWELQTGSTPAADAAATEPGTLPALQIETATVRRALIRYVDHATGQEMVLSDADLTLGLPDMAGAATLSGSARLNGVALTVEASLDGVAPLLAGEVRGIELALGSGGNNVAFRGRVGLEPLAAEGRLEADLPALDRLMAAAGQPAVSLPEGLGADRVALSGDVTLTGGDRLFLRGGALQLDDNSLRVEADASLGGARPRLVAKVTTDRLDLSGLVGGGDAGASPAGGAAGWPTDPIDVSGLSAADVELAFTAGSIVLGDFTLGATDLVARLEQGRLATEIRRLSAFDGGLSGELVVNGRSGLSVAGDLAATGMQLQPMLAALADYERLLGPLDAQVSFLGSGASVDAIMRSLSGDGRLDIGKGELQGFDLAAMLRNLSTAAQGAGAKTIFDSITGSFIIAGGVLTNEDLNFAAPLVSATGSGRADLGNQTVKYRVMPVALASREGDTVTGGVRVPVLIEGPWADPSIRPDLENMLQGEIGQRREEIEQKARDAVQGEIGKRLGVEAVEGEKVEDTLKRGIEEKAGSALRGLFGGGNN